MTFGPAYGINLASERRLNWRGVPIREYVWVLMQPQRERRDPSRIIDAKTC